MFFFILNKNPSGGNELFGFVKSFRASHYCRCCELSNEECAYATVEDIDRIRKIEDYIISS